MSGNPRLIEMLRRGSLSEPATRLMAQAADEIERLWSSLRYVRSHGIVAGAAITNRNPDWQERVTDVLDRIDAVLPPAAKEE